MKRKTFIKGTVPVATLPFLLNSLPLRALGQGSFFENALPAAGYEGRALILVQLDGGNDGLSSVVPLDKYPALSAARKNVLIDEKSVLRLHGTHATGFHPAMAKLQKIYNNKQLTVIQGVGYPNPIYSHFRATDIWHTGSGSSTVLNTGWMGRFLNKEYPGFPAGYPNYNLPDPPALQIGAELSNVLRGPLVGMGMTLGSTTDFYDLVLGKSKVDDSAPWSRELSFINTTAQQTQKYLVSIKKAAAQKNQSALYPPHGDNPLADQMKIAAQLIGGGLKTKVYVVSLPGFDTHHNQVDPSDHKRGPHAKLLSQLSEAIAAFEDDLKLMGKLDNVIGMTYSEFGRRIKSNGSDGTDHGSSGPMILFGSKLKGGLVGTNPEIPAKADVNDNLATQHDFRSVYASVLKGWFGISDEELSAVLPEKYPLLDLFK